MNVISFQRSFGRFGLHLDIIAALSLGIGLNFFPASIGLGISLGPFVLSLSYSKPHDVGTDVCPGGTCDVIHQSPQP